MKRGAERQLTKDGPDEDDELEEIQDPEGFQKADETVLARRQIRALPKRALAGSKAPSLNGLTSTPAPDADKVESAGPPKFSGFAGFGSVSNSFTFTAPQPTSTPAPSGPDPAFKPIQSTTTFKAAVMPSFPGAIKLNPPESEQPLPKPITPPSTQEGDDTALKYFKSLRGLNASFLSAISKEVEKDPFFDVASLIESYRNLRTTIQSEFDGSSQSSTTSGPPSTSSTSLFGQKGASEKPAPAFSMPMPPTSFSFGGVAVTSSTVPSTSEIGTKTGGFSFPAFTPPSSTPSQPSQLPFSLTLKSSESTTSSSSTTPPEPPKSAFTFGTSTSTSTLDPPVSSGFSFSTAPSTTTITSKSAGVSSQGSESSSGTPPASTTPTFGGSSVPNFFANSKTTSAFGTSDASKPISAFSPSIFGSSSTAESSKPSSGSDSAKPTLFSSTTTSASIFGSSDKPTSIFGTASSSQPKPSAFGFGKPAGSIGNPVGFGFGSSSTKCGDGAMTPGSSGSNSGFIFGAPATKFSDSLYTPPTIDKSSELTPQPETEGGEEGGEDEGVKLLPSANHDEEGEGEEAEETTHVVKCKVFRLFKSEDKSEWKDLGIGMLRLKKHKETTARRMLLRNSNTGRILINFRLYASLKPSLAKTAVSFIGYDNSMPVSFTIRVKTEAQAAELKQAIEREVAAAQATE